MSDGLTVAVIGTGPRGVSVVERLVTRIGERGPSGPVTVYAIDAFEVGCGRTWRTDQPDELLMDNSTDELTAFSGPSDGGPARPGHGPTFAEWYRASGHTAGVVVGDAVYAPRRAYGEYLTYVFTSVVRHAPEGVTVVPVREEVLAVTKDERGAYVLSLGSGGRRTADRVVFATGHADVEDGSASGVPAELDAADADFPFLRARPAAEVDFDRVPAGATVGVLGMGLSFYDVLACLTLGRGGRFVRDGGDGTDGGLRYLPSGREPRRIVAGSRTGVPIRVRGVHQRLGVRTYDPVLFTESRVRSLRRPGHGDFAKDVQPWISAEVNVAYFHALIGAERGPGAAESFLGRVRTAQRETADPGQAVLAARDAMGMSRHDPIDLAHWAEPFAGETFRGPDDFERALRRVVRDDLAHARRGNIDDPLKSALEVLRATRNLQRLAVDFGGLSPASHRAFVAGLAQPLSFLSAGTPLVRAEQFLALLDSGHLRVAGPGVRCSWDAASGRAVLTSPQVGGGGTAVDALIDARLPKPDLYRDRSQLTKQLVKDGIWTSYFNEAGGDAFDTGGVAVSEAPYHPVDASGRPDGNLYVLGLPTEHVRWFMHVGVTPPGYPCRGLGADAEAVVADLLAA
ncbi:methylaspartate mutase epsilon subunit [Streptomyces sp. Amel2xB2]|uniref:FAD/NAD(P)-binding protein n=1 Tax=Streptomyces sp. Amel2xB2 TaxID=1305829 RepID=UPI000DBA0E1E|nr:FAD/NAD(P)-binding protein [Streptomyces sp. Amel2xB2]RAJ58760.1 methylaspartate mutase epsilon subunit [Streptomyces sp. Amel2xB2]